jgi:hypothetical protein
MKLPGIRAIHTWDDVITEAHANSKIERKLETEKAKARRRELTGELIKYVPIGDGYDGYRVMCGNDHLGDIY